MPADPAGEDEPVAVLAAVEEGIASTLGASLVGLYVGGSWVSGDFDAGVSDLDLIAVLTRPMSDDLVSSLRGMHGALARRYPSWDGRIEVVYVPRAGLADLPGGIARMAVISPGEPLHILDGGTDWVLTWYPARREAVSLIGPPVTDLIPDIAHADYIEAVRDYVAAFGARIGDDATPGSQAYAVLSACRGLYTVRFGERPSKRRAADWASGEFPQWSGLIARALLWRAVQWTEANRHGAATVAETRRFLEEMARRILL